MRIFLVVSGTLLLLAACNPLQPSAGTPEGEGDGEGYGAVLSSSSSSTAMVETHVTVE
ncbi:MAG TPA: hypothetical protein PKV72_06340 [Candidatus Peribacteria bacterium]|nr:hypothetical protein [Candidatus Peribacteria bacterium]